MGATHSKTFGTSLQAQAFYAKNGIKLYIRNMTEGHSREPAMNSKEQQEEK